MPTTAQWQAAMAWALQQTYTDPALGPQPVTASTPGRLVDAVREYLNAHGINYVTFSFADVKPYLP